MRDSADREVLQRAAEMVKRGVKIHGTYERLAKAVGVSASTLNRVRKRKIVPGLLVVDRLARALGETFYVGRRDD